jgi:hypothetical protein
MQNSCLKCAQQFEITDEDLNFYDKISPIIEGKKYPIPSPALCPDCRRQRRLAWRNECHLYKRKCDLTGRQIFSIYPEDVPFPVYSPEAWYSDDCDPMQYGRDFDFTRPFFEQFLELQNKVPRIANILYQTENCDFCNIIVWSKNCYLVFGSINCEDCLYGNPFFSKNCIDSLMVINSTLCYECVDCTDLYECFFCQNCFNSRNLEYCFNVAGSSDCFLCAGLRKAKHCILNKSYSESEYKRKVAEWKQKGRHEIIKALEHVKQSVPVKYMVGINNEDVTGDIISKSKNCKNLFQGKSCEDVNYSSQIMESHNLMDSDCGERSEFLYEDSGFSSLNNALFCHWSWECANVYYCSTCCMNTSDCFGCISLRHKQYCILNKQYSKEEYQKLVPKIIEHMRKTGEWGEFFPVNFSPFAYNETLSQEYFPLTKEQVQAKGWKWKEEDKHQYQQQTCAIPDDIKDVKDAITHETLACINCSKNYKIVPQELAFYQKMNLTIPRKCSDCRHKNRLALRNPRKLYARQCAKCNTEIHTTYAPTRPEIVYCESCYLKEIY